MTDKSDGGTPKLMTRGQALLAGGNLVTGGGSVILLVTALQMLGQHGEEFLSVRRELRQLTNELQSTTHEIDARLIRLELKQTDHGESLALIRQASQTSRQDSWTRNDDVARMSLFEQEVKNWARALVRKTQHADWRNTPLSIPALIEIQRAIMHSSMNAEDAWTKDGKPRVDAIEGILGRSISERDRDSAWTLIQTGRSLAPGRQ